MLQHQKQHNKCLKESTSIKPKIKKRKVIEWDKGKARILKICTHCLFVFKYIHTYFFFVFFNKYCKAFFLLLLLFSLYFAAQFNFIFCFGVFLEIETLAELPQFLMHDLISLVPLFIIERILCVFFFLLIVFCLLVLFHFWHTIKPWLMTKGNEDHIYKHQ